MPLQSSGGNRATGFPRFTCGPQGAAFAARWQSGYAAACKAVYVGSIPARASRLNRHPRIKLIDNPTYRIEVLGDVLRLEVQGIAPGPRGLGAVATAVEEARKNA